MSDPAPTPLRRPWLPREARGYVLFGTLLFVVLEVLLAVAIIWWPNFAENMGSVKKLSAPLPMLQDMVGLIEMIGVPAYVVGQHFFKGCNTLGSAAAVLFGILIVAGEAHRGTLEIWLARPVTRLRLWTERWVGGWLAINLPVLLTTLTVPPLLARIDETMRVDHLLLCALHQGLFLGAIYGLTTVFSAVASNPIKIAFVMLFASIFEFAIYLVKEITHFSAFRLVDIETFAAILDSSRLDLKIVLPLALVNVASYGVGYALFRRRTP